VRIKKNAGEPKVSGNFVNHYSLAGAITPTWGLVYGTGPGPDVEDLGPATTMPQGTVFTNSAMGNLWVTGNILPAGNQDQYSTIPSPNPVPTNAQVKTYPALELRDQVVPDAGIKYRSTNEQAMLSEMVSTMERPTELRILSVTPTNCVLELNAPAGFQNELQFSDSLAPATWQSLTNFAVSGDLVNITDALTGVSCRFYRVITTGLH